MIEELIQVQMRIQRFDQVGAPLVTLGGRQAGAGMNAGMINTLQPGSGLLIPCLERWWIVEKA